jgi:hypothetical protein
MGKGLIQILQPELRADFGRAELKAELAGTGADI